MTEHGSGVIFLQSGVTRLKKARILPNAALTGRILSMTQHFAAMTKGILLMPEHFAAMTEGILSVTKQFADIMRR
jgi:hypothetical protein